MTESVRLLLATADVDELADLRELLIDASVECIAPEEIGLVTPELPGGGSYTDRARYRAHSYAEVSGERSLAICAGLDIYALDLAPGALTEMFAGGSSWEGRCQALLKQLASTPVGQRIAVGRAAAAVVSPGLREEVTITTSIIECTIAVEPRGTGGYGLDAVTQLVSGETLAELSTADRNRLGHRGKAVRSILPNLV